MAFTRNDQPFYTYNYNTDQFVDPADPISGITIHDDGSPTYTSPKSGLTYTKIRVYDGQSPSGYISYRIEFGPGVEPPVTVLVLTDDAETVILTNDAQTVALTPD